MSLEELSNMKYQSLVNDAQIRQRLVAGVSNDYLSVILERGYISQQKLDYKQWLRFSNTSTGTETLELVTGRLYGKTHTSEWMSKLVMVLSHTEMVV